MNIICNQDIKLYSINGHLPMMLKANSPLNISNWEYHSEDIEIDIFNEENQTTITAGEIYFEWQNNWYVIDRPDWIAKFKMRYNYLEKGENKN